MIESDALIIVYAYRKYVQFKNKIAYISNVCSCYANSSEQLCLYCAMHAVYGRNSVVEKYEL